MFIKVKIVNCDIRQFTNPSLGFENKLKMKEIMVVSSTTQEKKAKCKLLLDTHFI